MNTIIVIAICLAGMTACIIWEQKKEEKKWKKREKELYEKFKTWLEMEGRI